MSSMFERRPASSVPKKENRAVRNVVIGLSIFVPCSAFSFLAGMQYAMRNEPILVEHTRSNLRAAAAIEEFGKVVRETDWCEVNRLANDPVTGK